MAELFVKDYEMVFPERVQYTYNAKLSRDGTIL